MAQPRAGGTLEAFADESHAVQKERSATKEREEDEVRFAHERFRLVEVARIESLPILRFVKEHEQRHGTAGIRHVIEIPDEIRKWGTDREYPIRVVAAAVDLGPDRGMRHDPTNERIKGDSQRLPLLGRSMLGQPAHSGQQVPSECLVIADPARH